MRPTYGPSLTALSDNDVQAQLNAIHEVWLDLQDGPDKAQHIGVLTVWDRYCRAAISEARYEWTRADRLRGDLHAGLTFLRRLTRKRNSLDSAVEAVWKDQMRAVLSPALWNEYTSPQTPPNVEPAETEMSYLPIGDDLAHSALLHSAMNLYLSSKNQENEALVLAAARAYAVVCGKDVFTLISEAREKALALRA